MAHDTEVFLLVCIGCKEPKSRVNRLGICSACYQRAYRKARRRRDPTYKPWQTARRARLSLTVSKKLKDALVAAWPVGERSRAVERALWKAIEALQKEP